MTIFIYVLIVAVLLGIIIGMAVHYGKQGRDKF